MLESKPSSACVDAGVLAAITYASCLIIDIPCALITGIGIVGVGSAALGDGLVLYPLGAFVLAYAFLLLEPLLLPKVKS
jgi:hypothetical protein